MIVVFDSQVLPLRKMVPILARQSNRVSLQHQFVIYKLPKSHHQLMDNVGWLLFVLA